jgi:methionyl aminopeptidase
MVLAIEPMVNLGGAGVRVLRDGWTAITSDRSLSAHFEHTVAVTADGAEVLSLGRGDKRAAGSKGTHEGTGVSQAHLR